MNAHPTLLFFVIYTYIYKCDLMGIFYAPSNKICSISTISLTFNMYVHSSETQAYVVHAGARKFF